MSKALTRLALTMGDPAGIGPEILLKALGSDDWQSRCQVTVFGSRRLLARTYQQLKALDVSTPLANPNQLEIVDIELGIEDQITVGQGDKHSGAASFAYLQTAINHTLQGQFGGIVTAPIAKIAWQAAGHSYPGQTEVLAQRADRDQFAMAFVGRSPFTGWTLRTLLATTHIPLRQVPEVLNPQLMTAKLELLLTSLVQDFGITRPTVAIAGLNPHSGEGGQLGREEQDWLIPWLETARQRYPQAQLVGPIPPDTMWVNAGQAWWHNSEACPYHGYLALYHDQGLIPVKLLAFDQAINTTIGLPFVRTSPDHGTAFDIVGRGMARADSFRAALALAVELVQQRLNSGQPNPRAIANG